MVAQHTRGKGGDDGSPLELWPHNIDAESAALGCILDPTLPDALAILADSLHITPRDFYRPAHEAIYAMALDLRAHHTPTDYINVGDALEFAGKLDEVGDRSYLSSLLACVPPSGDPTSYGEIIKRSATQRRGMELSAQLAKSARLGDFDDVARIQGDIASLLTQTQPAKPRFQLLSVADMLALPRPEPLIDRILSLNSLGLMFGPSSVGKSVLLLDLMAHIALGWPWQGHAVTAGPVVYICAEGAAFMGERLQGWMTQHGGDDIPNLHILPVATQLLEAATVPDLLHSMAAQLPSQPVLLAVDTLSQTSAGADENAPSEMARYIAAMNQLREATGAHVLAVHHTGKDEAKGLRGASSLRGNIDTVIEIKPNGDHLAVMHCDKQRGGWVEFPDWSYRIAKQALDEHADRTAPIIEALGPADITSCDELPNSQQLALQALHGHPEGLSASEWERETRASGVEARRTFYSAQRQLLDVGLVHKKDARYFLTPDGLRLVQLQ